MTTKTPRTSVRDYLQNVGTEYEARRTIRRRSVADDDNEDDAARTSSDSANRPGSKMITSTPRISKDEEEVTPRHIIQNVLTVQGTDKPVTRKRKRFSDVVMGPPLSSAKRKTARRRSSLTVIDLDDVTQKYTPRTNVAGFLEQALEETPAARKSVPATDNHSTTQNVSSFMLNEVGVSLLEARSGTNVSMNASARGGRFLAKKGNLNIPLPQATPVSPSMKTPGTSTPNRSIRATARTNTPRRNTEVGSRTSTPRKDPSDITADTPETNSRMTSRTKARGDDTLLRSRTSTPRRESGAHLISGTPRSETSPNRRSETTPNRQSEITPSRLSETSPSRRSETSPNTRSETTPSRRSEISPNRRSETTPSRRSETTPSRRSITRAIISTEDMDMSTENGQAFSCSSTPKGKAESDSRQSNPREKTRTSLRSGTPRGDTVTSASMRTGEDLELDSAGDIPNEDAGMISISDAQKGNVTAEPRAITPKGEMPRDSESSAPHNKRRISLRTSTPRRVADAETRFSTPKSNKKLTESVSSISPEILPPVSPVSEFHKNAHTRGGRSELVMSALSEGEGGQAGSRRNVFDIFGERDQNSSNLSEEHVESAQKGTPAQQRTESLQGGRKTQTPITSYLSAQKGDSTPATSTPEMRLSQGRASSTRKSSGSFQKKISEVMSPMNQTKRISTVEKSPLPKTTGGLESSGSRAMDGGSASELDAGETSLRDQENSLSQAPVLSSQASRLSQSFNDDEPLARPEVENEEMHGSLTNGHDQGDDRLEEPSSAAHQLQMPVLSPEVQSHSDENESSEEEGYSPLKTPYLEDRQHTPSTGVTTLTARNRNAVETRPALTEAMKRKASTSRSRRKSRPGLPTNVVKATFSHFCHLRVSKDAIEEVEKMSDQYWQNVAEDLEAYALHAHKKTIDETDFELLMKRQGFISDSCSLNTLIAKYLPLELRQALIPIARSGNQLDPKR